jgi:hypothetical protein
MGIFWKCSEMIYEVSFVDHFKMATNRIWRHPFIFLALQLFFIFVSSKIWSVILKSIFPENPKNSKVQIKRFFLVEFAGSFDLQKQYKKCILVDLFINFTPKFLNLYQIYIKFILKMSF